jgi:membrane-bound lytic murein transglycosylase A
MVRRQNRQVVFFRIVGLNDDREAIGAQGIPLTAGRSIAVDKALHAYGTPFFIEADLPLTSPSSQSSFRRLMIAQDTGSAIIGPARADLFFGAGEEAGQIAARIAQSGRVAMFIPRELGSSIAATSVPLPRAKPGPSLASYAFRPVAPPQAKPEPLRAAASTPGPSRHPAALSARPEPPRINDRTQYAAGQQAKPALLRSTARARSEVLPPLAKPGQPQPVPSPPSGKEPVSNHALHPSALPSAKAKLSQNSAPVGRPVSTVGYESGTRAKAPFSRPRSDTLKPQPRITPVREQGPNR